MPLTAAEQAQAAARLAEVARRRSARGDWAGWCGDTGKRHEPTEKQAEFLRCGALEALYGGAAGGGKSDALLMAALQYVHVPGYAALLLRRTYADLSLPGAIMDRAKAWFIPKGVDWNDKEKRFTFPSGATLTFGYLDTDRDRYRYQGAELQFLGFDELTQFPEAWYRYLLSRLRRLTGAAVPLRARAASNPGGVGHDWVRRRFVEDTREGRAFVPATLADNPHLDAEAYRVALAQLDENTRRQLLEGVWVRDGSGLVYRCFSEDRNLCGPVTCERHVLGIDYGFTDDCAFSVLGWNAHDPTVYILESFKRPGMLAPEAAGVVLELQGRYRFDRIVGDIGGLGKGYAEEAIQRYHIPIEPAEKTNKLGYINIMNGELERGSIKIVEAACSQLTDEWRELPWNETHQKEAEGFANHCADSALYGWRAATAFVEKPVVASVKLTEEQIVARNREARRREGLSQTSGMGKVRQQMVNGRRER